MSGKRGCRMMAKGGPVVLKRFLLSFVMAIALHASPAAEFEKASML